MDINRMTMKSQEALQTAQNIAVQRGHQEIGTEHLMIGLLANETDLIPRLFNNMNIPLSTIKDRLDQILARMPRVSGPGMTPDKFYVSQELSEILVIAEEEMKALKDEYLSVEHIVLFYMQKSIWSRYLQHGLHRRTSFRIILQVADFSHNLGYDFGSDLFAIISGYLFI